MPGCDSRKAKDVLSDIFKQNNVEATGYDEIKTLTSGKDEVTCSAILSLKDGSKLDLDYKLAREGSDIMLRVTRSNP